MKNFSYLVYILKHKLYVFQACLLLNVPLWRAISHDWTKFLPSEFSAYANYFYDDEGNKKTSRTDAETVAYMAAWQHHEANNKHHWGYWVCFNAAPERYLLQAHGDGYPLSVYDPLENFRTEEVDDDLPDSRAYKALASLKDLLNRNSKTVAIEMPETYVREMVADWAGAGRAITGSWDFKGWYLGNKSQIILHPKSRELAEFLVDELMMKMGIE